MKLFGCVVVGVIVGIVAGFAAMFLAMYIVAPLMGNTDEMSSGFIGLFTFVIGTPILVVIGAVMGYKHAIKSDKNKETQ